MDLYSSLSYHLATLSTTWIGSFIILWISSETAFSRVTNMCAVVAGIVYEYETKEVVRFAPFVSPSLIFVLLGSASYAFHTEVEIGAPKHTLDIFFAWLLVLHLFYVTVVTCATSLLSYYDVRRIFISVAHVSIALGFIFLISFVTYEYSYVYKNQLMFYIVLGSPSIILGCMFRATLNDVKNVVSSTAVKIMLYELIVSLSLLTAAIFSQCEQVGVKYSHSSDPAAYGFYHGLWHLQISTVISMNYFRLRSIALDAKDDVCVCHQSKGDFFGLFLFALFSTLSIILKETKVDLYLAKLLLTGVICLIACHVLVLLTRIHAHRQFLPSTLHPSSSLPSSSSSLSSSAFSSPPSVTSKKKSSVDAIY